MSTRLDLENSCMASLRRSDATTRGKVINAIQTAIAYYNEKRFYFLEEVHTFTTSISLAWYASPSDIQDFDTMLMTVSGNDFPVNRVTHDEIARKDTGNIIGDPDEWAYFEEQIRFYPVPNASYVATLYYHRGLTAESASSSNAWTNAGKELIKHRALWDVFSNYLRDDGNATRAEKSYGQAFDNLWNASCKRMSTGKTTKKFW